MPDAESDLALILAAAQEASEIALRHFRGAPKVWDKADGMGPVTEADLEVDRILAQILRKARPTYGWLSEETEDSADRLDAETVFVVDPIDGTRAFIDGHSDWAISVAIVHQGQPVAGVVVLPERGDLYAASRGGGASRNGDPIRASKADDIEQIAVLTTKPNMQDRYWKGSPPAFHRRFRSSLAYRLCLVAEGRYDAMLALRPTWEWDIAAGSLIVAEASGRATDGNGAQLRFNNPHPQVSGILAGGAAHDPILSRLRRDLSPPGNFTLPT